MDGPRDHPLPALFDRTRTSIMQGRFEGSSEYIVWKSEGMTTDRMLTCHVSNFGAIAFFRVRWARIVIKSTRSSSPLSSAANLGTRPTPKQLVTNSNGVQQQPLTNGAEMFTIPFGRQAIQRPGIYILRANSEVRGGGYSNCPLSSTSLGKTRTEISSSSTPGS